MRDHLGAAGSILLAIALTGCGGSEPERVGDTSPGSDGVEAVATTPAGSGPPTVQELVIRPASPVRGDAVVVDARRSTAGEDGVDLEYRWRVNDRPVGDDSPRLELGDVQRDSLVEVTVVARGGEDRTMERTASVRVANQAPVVQAIRVEPSGTVSADRDLVAEPDAVDPDADPLTFTFRWWVNDQFVSDSGPSLSFEALGRGDRIRVGVIASDGSTTSDELFSETFTVGNTKPRIVSEPAGLGSDGQFRYAVRAEDPDGDRHFAYRLLRAPAGMAIGEFDGVVSWRPTEVQAGRHPVEIEVDDRRGGRTTQQFTLEIVSEPVGRPAARQQ